MASEFIYAFQFTQRGPAAHPLFIGLDQLRHKHHSVQRYTFLVNISHATNESYHLTFNFTIT
jgi:hypothetical protein